MRNYSKVQTAARGVKTIGLVLLLAGWTHTVRGFTPIGPLDTWQTPNLGYDPISGPQNLGEEYRFSTPTLFYAFESSFLDYFGSNGVADVQKAIKMLNDLPAFSRLSQGLAEYPVQSQRINYQAEALLLYDLKSVALHMLVEQLGLAEAERYSWTLRARFPFPPGAPCPFYRYSVIQRNFDPVTLNPSAYVNGTLYSYFIVEFCPAADAAIAVPYQVDPLAFSYTSVAGLNF